MKPLLIAGALLIGMAVPANASPKEDRVKAAFQEAGIPTGKQHPAMIAFAICVQRKVASHTEVAASLQDDFGYTPEQADEAVSIAENLWCPQVTQT